MPSSLPAAALVAVIAPLAALCQSQTPTPCPPAQKLGGWLKKKTGGVVGTAPCAASPKAPAAQTAVQANADVKSKFHPASGFYTGAFLARNPSGQMSVMGPITWHYRSSTDELPTIFWNPGIVLNGNVSTPTLWFAGDNGAVQDGQGHYYLETGRTDADAAFRITIAGGKYEVTIVEPKAVPPNLLKLDGTKPETQAPAAQTVAGTLQIKVNDPNMARSILLQTPSRDNDPLLREGVRVAVITAADNTPVTVYQTNLDPPDFWRLVHDNSQARLFDNGKITLLRRVLNARNGHWDIIDASGQKTGEYINPGYASLTPKAAPVVAQPPQPVASVSDQGVIALLSISPRTVEALREMERANSMNSNPDKILRAALLRFDGIKRDVRQDQGDADNFWRDDYRPDLAYRFVLKSANAPEVFAGTITALRRTNAGWTAITVPPGQHLREVLADQ